MKNTLKKLLCVVLSVLLFCGTGVAAFADDEPADETEAAADGVKDIPVIYVAGIEDTIYSDKNDIESETYLTKSLPDGAVGNIISSVSGELLSGMVTGRWDDFCNALYNALSPYFRPLALDGSGNPINETGYDCLKEKELTDKAVNGCYGIFDYRFIYDWRLDPYSNAVELDSYIRSVKTATGAEKVNITAAGLGYSTLLAYFRQFGEKDINECIIYEAGINGIDIVGVLMSGELSIDDVALNRYIQENLSDADIVMSLAQYAADLVLSNGFADSLLELVARLYKVIYANVVPRILIESFATMPGLWSAVGEEYYETAKSLQFSDDTQSGADYGILIKKLDRFHYDVLGNAQSILNAARKNGVNIYNIVKYGYQVIPVYKAANAASDGILSLDAAAPGVTCAPAGEKLADEYIAAAEESGSIRFISPDHEVDASTAMLPMHTWYIKLLRHNALPEPVETLMENIFNADGYTSVLQLESCKQFLVCNTAGTRMETLTSTGVITPTFQEQLEEYFTFDSPTGVLKKMFILVAEIVKLMRSFIRIFTEGDIFRP